MTMRSAMAAVAAGLAVAALTATAAMGTFAGENGRIAFTMRTETGEFDVYTMKPDGSSIVQVTDHPARDFNPRWSPDGTKIAFSSNRDGEFDIYVVHADGGTPARITGSGSDAVSDFVPSWSADGESIVFQRQFPLAQAEIWSARADGSGGEAKLVDGYVPGTSPRGKKVAYSGRGDDKLHVLNLGDGATNVVTTGSPNQLDGEPSWSPTGNDLVFSRDVDGTQNDLYVVHHDGSNLVQLTATPSSAASEGSPVWSPDGTRIAFSLCDFSGGVQGNCSISTMSADGSDVTPIVIEDVLFQVGGRIDWQAAA